MNTFVHIGTCSWKYDSWRGLVYPETGAIDYLGEYARQYHTVEVDQWFWSLFGADTVVLPRDSVVRAYQEATPDTFIFAIKVPNAVTLTQFYRKSKRAPLVANPHFLSMDIMNRFLEKISPLGKKIWPLMFQFEYLSKEKMGGCGVL